jgi:hypothetical protein
MQEASVQNHGLRVRQRWEGMWGVVGVEVIHVTISLGSGGVGPGLFLAALVNHSRLYASEHAM